MPEPLAASADAPAAPDQDGVAVRRATYRLQLTPDFTLRDAADVVPYLASLGVSHVYLSPILQAVEGSTHGYDVADHRRINAELGGEQAFAELCAAASEHGLLLLVDIVPNHMAVTTAGGGRQNRQWWDILQRGPASEFAHWIDVDWTPWPGRAGPRVLLPVLGERYGRELIAGDLRLVPGGDGPEVAYHDHRFPLAAESLELLGDGSTRELDAINAEPASLHRVLDFQHYRLTYWKNATTELNYRRFFDVTTLAGLRVEDADVFAATHELPLRWVHDGVVDGLRIDHPDGLRDPAGYLTDLANATGGCWTLVEKILEPGEQLVNEWACDGTTGYDFMGVLGGVLVDGSAEAEMREIHDEFVGSTRSFDEVSAESKRLIVRELLVADTARVVDWALRVCAADRRTADATAGEVRTSIEELLVAFPVYRTYVTADGTSSATDVEVLTDAAGRVAARGNVAPELLDVITGALLGSNNSADAVELRARFQQLTGPTMAKSVEDTAFYRYLPLVSLNEVGGDPGRFGLSTEEFHEYQQGVAQTWPSTMLASSTHDTKRSEDVRARINLLAEIPDQWRSAVTSWRRMSARWWPADAEPDRSMEYLLYQVLFGARPLPLDRALAYFAKASREAKVRTSWLSPDERYEAALESFITAALDDGEFATELDRFCAPLVVPGRMASLAQVVLKLTSPGVPDVYQGSELWTDSLVDPDNRRRVDFAERRRLLQAATGVPLAELGPLASDVAGITKLWLTRLLLDVRASHPQAFAGTTATYEPLQLAGAHAADGLAYLRGADVVVVAAIRPVHLATGGEPWAGTTLQLPEGSWHNLVEGRRADGTVSLVEHAATLGSAVFVREST